MSTLKNINTKYINILGLLRIVGYIILFATFIIIPKEYFINHPTTCVIRSNFGLMCPCCGVTRSFSCIMHFDFTSAIKYNIIFALAIFPICLITFVNDTIFVLLRIISKRNVYSLIERFILNV